MVRPGHHPDGRRASVLGASLDRLDIRCGPFSWWIRLEEIESVHPTRSLRSGPELSFDRLCITSRGGRRVLVSPEDWDGFLAAISQARATAEQPWDGSNQG